MKVVDTEDSFDLCEESSQQPEVSSGHLDPLPGLFPSAWLALPAWDEYAASRLSAPWGTDDYAVELEQTLCGMLETTLARGQESKQKFQQHRDFRKTIDEIADVYGGFFIRASYLIGHLDGTGKEASPEGPQLMAMIAKITWLQNVWESYCSILRSLFEKHGEWEGVVVLEPLKDIFEQILTRGF